MNQTKPANPEPLPDDKDHALASMGIYVFNMDVLSAELNRDNSSMLGSGSLVSGGSVVNSILSARVRIDDQAQVDSCILFDNVCVGAGSKLRRCIVDKDVQIPPGTHIGFDQQADAKNFHVSPNGIIAIPKLWPAG